MADTKIKDLPVNSSPTGAEKIPSTDGVTTKHVTIDKLREPSAAHAADTTNPHATTASHVGLGNVDNTSDVDKPVSTAQQAEIDTKLDASEKGAISGVATLDAGGKVPATQMPDISISEFLGEAANEVAMLAFTGQKGDWCVRTDEIKTYIIIANDGSTLTDWRQVLTPTGDVISVNSQTGVVVLDTDDVSEGTNNKYVTVTEKAILGNTSGTNTGDEVPASPTAAGVSELATIVEIDAGVDASRTITPAGLKGSALQTKVDGIEASADNTATNETSHTDVVVDSDFSANGAMERTGEGAYTTILNKRDATVAPTATDDSGSGYTVGSRWVDITADKEYVCVDATATSAVWTETTGAGGGGGGGGVSDNVNIETLTADKTLVVGVDDTYQYLDGAATTRSVIFDTASATEGAKFFVYNAGSHTTSEALIIQQGTLVLQTIYAGGRVQYIFDGTNWHPADDLSPASTTLGYGRNVLAIGFNAKTHDNGIAIGASTIGVSESVAIGASADAGDQGGVAIGWSTRVDGTRGVVIGYDAATTSHNGIAIGYLSLVGPNGTAVGYDTYADGRGTALGYLAEALDDYGTALGCLAKTSKRYSTALGYYSRSERSGEIAMNIGAQTNQENNMTIVGLAVETVNNTPANMVVGDYVGQYFTVRSNSILSGKLVIVGRDNTTGECNVYHRSVAIKNDGTTTTLVGTVQDDMTIEEDATWDVAITADDTNDALQVEVTGDATNIVQWSARFDGVETHF